MRTWGTLLVAAVIVGAPVAAHADEKDIYTPDNPVSATLAGSVVTGECRNEETWLRYTVEVTSPEDVAAASGTVSLLIEDPSRDIRVPLGPLVDGSAVGSVPWPEAEEATLRRMTGDGTAPVTLRAVIRVQPAGLPALAVPVTIPTCDPAPAALAATGISGWMPTFGFVGAGLLAAGAAIGLLRRTRQR